jgi:uncharacterized protein (TIGR02246 family)
MSLSPALKAPISKSSEDVAMSVLRVNGKIAVTLLCLWPAAVSAQTEDVAAQIAEANKQFATAFAKGDADQVANMYSEDGKVLPPNTEVVSGRRAIRAFWSKAMESGIGTVTLKASEVEAHGDTVIEMGNYVLLGKSGKEIDHGKYLVVWKRDQGAWRLYRDCWNSNTPLAKSGGDRH